MKAKTVSYVHGVALFLGAVLGSGILILPGYTAEVAGPASILSWALLSLVSIPLAYTFMRLALKYQNLGGISTIVKQAFGIEWSAVAGWFYFCMVSVGDAVVALTGAGYLVIVFSWSHKALYIIAVIFLATALISNLLGMRTSGGFSLALSGLVLVILVATIGMALPGISFDQFSPFFPWGLKGGGRPVCLFSGPF